MLAGHRALFTTERSCPKLTRKRKETVSTQVSDFIGVYSFYDVYKLILSH